MSCTTPSASAPAPIWLWEQIERDLGTSEIVTGYGTTNVVAR